MKTIRTFTLAAITVALAFAAGCQSMPSGGSNPPPSGHRH